MSTRELAAYIETVIPTPKDADGHARELPDVIKRRREEIAYLVFNGHHTPDGITDATAGTATAWRAYNAVTEYWDHTRAREAKSLSAKTSAWDSAIFGAAAANKALALRALVAA
jgi:hypothetical protein